MTPREGVAKAFGHQEPERVPLLELVRRSTSGVALWRDWRAECWGSVAPAASRSRSDSRRYASPEQQGPRGCG